MYPRDILEKIRPFLETDDVLLFYGARQVGKTSLMKYLQETHFSDRSFFFDLEKPANLRLLNGDPDLFVEYLKSYHGWQMGKKIVVFIDEIQYLDRPTSLLKYLHDAYPDIKCVVSGSSTLEIRGKIEDSMVGRLVKFDVFPLSFSEFLIFKDKPNLAKMVGKTSGMEPIDEELKFYFEEYSRFGGYPKVVLARNAELKREYLAQIYETYVEKDIRDIWKIREVAKFNALIRILANQAGSLCNVSELANTVDVTAKTIQDWLLLLENTFVIRTVRPFSSNLRSELTKMPKIFFIDHGLRNLVAGDFEPSGNGFENAFFCLANHSYRNTDIRFYRTQSKKEIDFILDGKPYELKLRYDGKTLAALDSFFETYDETGTVVTLEKRQPNPKYRVAYPWEI